MKTRHKWTPEEARVAGLKGQQAKRAKKYREACAEADKSNPFIKLGNSFEELEKEVEGEFFTLKLLEWYVWIYCSIALGIIIGNAAIFLSHKIF